MLKLKGDTLIEVTIAVGIFSMIAVIIVSVVNGSASGAQVALETTLAREEIDAQAEALRFIQSSYISSNGGMSATTDTKYIRLWDEITKNAKNSSEAQYDPGNCADLYNPASNLSDQGAFIINTKGLKNANPNDIIIKASSENEKIFFPASTYPRVIYPSNNLLFTDEEKTDNTNIINRVEGIYIVAVKDINGTTIVSNDSTTTEKIPAYYDFYIRTCWYGPGADRPSTISTVIRLYNPKIGSL